MTPRLPLDDMPANRPSAPEVHITHDQMSSGRMAGFSEEIPMPDLLIVQRADKPEHTPEAEGLLVDVGTPGVVRLVLDDGLELTMPRDELLAALATAA